MSDATCSESVVISRRKRRRFILLTFTSILMASGALVLRSCLPSHPQFGPIYQVTAMELNNTSGRSKVAEFLRKNLPRRFVQSRFFPDRYKNPFPGYVDLGDAQLYWSAGPNAGWLYFWGRAASGGLALDKWEFAPCAETDLRRVTEFPSVFYGSRDPSLTNVFGAAATTNAINLSVGQIVFARWVPDPKLLYVFKFGEQHDEKIRINYCVRDTR